MLRALVSWRGLVLSVAAAGVVVACGMLAVWQWHRSEPPVTTAGLPVAELSQVVPVHGRIVTRDEGRRVSLSGVWRPDRQVLVADRRRPDGDRAAGRWVVTPVEVTGIMGWTGQRFLVPVVRGWVPGTPAPVDVPAPAGPASVTGWVQPSEALDAPGADWLQAPGVVSRLNAADLVNRWPEDVGDAFVIAGGPSSPGLDVGVATALPGPVTAAREQRDWRNVAYAAQWWVFAAFAIALWWLAVRDVAAADRRRAAAPVSGARPAAAEEAVP